MNKEILNKIDIVITNLKSLSDYHDRIRLENEIGILEDAKQLLQPEEHIGIIYKKIKVLENATWDKYGFTFLRLYNEKAYNKRPNEQEAIRIMQEIEKEFTNE